MRLNKLLAVAGMGTLLLPMLAQAEDALCPRGNATLHGNYMSEGGGTVTVTGLVAFVGRINFDGDGGLDNPVTASRAGTIVHVDFAGTYTVNLDCSGSFVLAGVQHFDFVVDPHGRKIDYIRTDPGTIVSGSASRMDD